VKNVNFRFSGRPARGIFTLLQETDSDVEGFDLGGFGSALQQGAKCLLKCKVGFFLNEEKYCFLT